MIHESELAESPIQGMGEAELARRETRIILELRAKIARLEKNVDILLAFINGRITRAEMEMQIKSDK